MARPDDSRQPPPVTIQPIGRVKTEVGAQQTGGFREVESEITLDARFEPMLAGIEEFSHLVVVYWLSETDECSVARRPQGREDVPVVGILASR